MSITHASTTPPDVPRAAPFIKWAGGKRALLKDLLPLVPAEFGTYHEPFVGGGALFWALRPRGAVIADANARLVHAYLTVRDDVDAVLAELRTYPYEKEFYLRTRSLLDEGTDAERAARFICVNRVGFNGLYRVNQRGQFNVPFGRYVNPTICDVALLRACSLRLHGVDVHRDDFASVLSRAATGDFVYFDPPYLPISATSSFTGYTPDGFSLRDHRRLRDTALELKARGAHVLISNSGAPAVRDLFAEGFDVIEVMAARAINASADRRGKIAELIIR